MIDWLKIKPKISIIILVSVQKHSKIGLLTINNELPNSDISNHELWEYVIYKTLLESLGLISDYHKYVINDVIIGNDIHIICEYKDHINYDSLSFVNEDMVNIVNVIWSKKELTKLVDTLVAAKWFKSKNSTL